jgi:hypothetical protein
MADENPMGRGTAVALDLPADQVGFLRGTFTGAREGVLDELQYHPGELKDPAYLHREEAAYGRLLTALDECVIVPDADVRAVVVDLAEMIDKGNEYNRVVFEHHAFHGLLAVLEPEEIEP